jgi:DNA-binding winged helix-turn-helix (wHTH) protein/alpha-beta hydrolase superfamily lysophospholipase
MFETMNTIATRESIYAFGDCELDTHAHELRCRGEVQHVEPQVFDVLHYLLSRHDRLITKEELLDGVWGHRYVAPTTLNSRIKSARQAVGDNGTAQRVIRTVHGRGFRIAVPVEQRAAKADSTAPQSGPSIIAQQIRFCTAPDNVRIAYATSGTGPPLVKTSNWLTHLEYDWESPVWRFWLRELSRDHTLVRYDERGNGLSDRDAADLSFEACLSDLETVVDTLGLERFPLFGLCKGSALAIAYAVKHPERVSRLVVYGGFLRGQATGARTPEEREEAKMLTTTLPLRWGQENPASRQFFAFQFLPEGTPEQHQWFSELVRITTSPEVAATVRTVAGQIDVTELADQVRIPTLVLHATGDAFSPFDQGREIASRISGSRFVALESRNHVLLEEEPACTRFLHEVRSFLQEGEA